MIKNLCVPIGRTPSITVSIPSHKKSFHCSPPACLLHSHYLLNRSFPTITFSRHFSTESSLRQQQHSSSSKQTSHLTNNNNNNIIDGRKHAAKIQDEIKSELQSILHHQQSKQKSVPGLAVVLMSNRHDSVTYVRMKKKMAEKLGFHSELIQLSPHDTSQAELIDHIQKLNHDPNIHGILVQLPLPDHIDEEHVLSQISPEKDVDGLHPINIGNLSMKERHPLFVPCTPRGIMELLDREHVKLEGIHVVVLGRSNIVGIPIALALIHRDATVTVLHSRSNNIQQIMSDADVIIAACGVARFVKREWVKQGAIVIDVGINEIDDATLKSGKRIVGDVDFDSVKEIAGKITPVPGGVGPMTIAMLMKNTMESFKRSLNIK